MRTGLLLLAYLSLLDVLTTAVGLGMGAREANLLPAWVLTHYGSSALWAAKAAITAGLIWAVWRLRHRYPRLRIGVAICNVLLGAVVASNLVQLS